jgi:serine/threonine protein phosphatase PrpC
MNGGQVFIPEANPSGLTYIPADAVAPPPYIESFLTHSGVRRAYKLVKRLEPFTAEYPALPEGAIEIAGRTDVGLIREHNEDSFLFGNLSGGEKVRENDAGILRVDASPAILMVADGVGGAASGEIASSLATEVAFTSLSQFSERGALKGAVVIADSLQQAVLAANRAIHNHSRENRVHHGMGTTATIALVIGGMVYFAQVGDSRAYVIRDGVAHQMTKDQSLVHRMVDAGKLTQEQAERSEHRNIILQALGPEQRVISDLYEETLEAGDLILVCSDGLSNQVTQNEIGEYGLAAKKPSDLCDALLARALETGAPDNVTALAALVKVP